MRALNGECCILPFKYNGQVYNNCTRAGGSNEAWCAVRLPFLGNETNWRQDCTGKYNLCYVCGVTLSECIHIGQAEKFA